MKSLKTLILLVLLAVLILGSGNSSILWAQQDSTNLELKELKQVSQLLVEVEYRREQSRIAIEKENLYRDLIADYSKNEELYEQKLENKDAEIEAVKPAWYDTFWIGSAVTGIIISTVYFLSR